MKDYEGLTIEKVDGVEKVKTQPLASAINDEIFDLYERLATFKQKLEGFTFQYCHEAYETKRMISYLEGTITGLEIADRLIKSANVSDTLTVLE